VKRKLGINKGRKNNNIFNLNANGRIKVEYFGFCSVNDKSIAVNVLFSCYDNNI
jgi:hypothetical protein